METPLSKPVSPCKEAPFSRTGAVEQCFWDKGDVVWVSPCLSQTAMRVGLRANSSAKTLLGSSSGRV
ncbi:hypothetical protein IF1G_00131 [Cordyceps javanica]|uniref:Uncharacterized protein n=1 Tax=Cordyceps javanica TaxID=43265 RepID=A0A545VF13_9HYPO|nr:hypothetical protein IF1G_00131 [Cordyceps javanica]